MGRDTIRFTQHLFSFVREKVKLCVVTFTQQFCIFKGEINKENAPNHAFFLSFPRSMCKCKTAVRFVSWIVKGLNVPVKRSRIFSHLEYLRSDIVFLQKTHLMVKDCGWAICLILILIAEPMVLPFWYKRKNIYIHSSNNHFWPTQSICNYFWFSMSQTYQLDSYLCPELGWWKIHRNNYFINPAL